MEIVECTHIHFYFRFKNSTPYKKKKNLNKIARLSINMRRLKQKKKLHILGLHMKYRRIEKKDTSVCNICAMVIFGLHGHWLNLFGFFWAI